MSFEFPKPSITSRLSGDVKSSPGLKSKTIFQFLLVRNNILQKALNPKMLSDSCVVSVPEIPCRTSEQFRHGDSSGAAAALP